MAVSRTTRRCNQLAIAATCKAWAPGSDPRGLITIAWRESRWNHLAEGDAAAAARAFERSKGKWSANPYVGSPGLWAASRGLFQLMTAYHLQRWDRMAHPWALYHPVVATVPAARLWNRAAQLGAKNYLDARIVWAYGSLKHKPGDPQYEKRVKTTRARLAALGYPESLATKPIAAFGLSPFGRGTQPGQEGKLAAISKALGLPQSPPPTETMPENWSCNGSADLPSGDDDDGSSTDDILPEAEGIPKWLIFGGLAALGLAGYGIGRSYKK